MCYIVLFFICTVASYSQGVRTGDCFSTEQFISKWRSYTYQVLKDSLKKRMIKFEEETQVGNDYVTTVRLDAKNFCFDSGLFGHAAFFLKAVTEKDKYAKINYAVYRVIISSSADDEMLLKQARYLFSTLNKNFGKADFDSGFFESLKANEDAALVFEELNSKKRELMLSYVRDGSKILLGYNSDSKTLLLAFTPSE